MDGPLASEIGYLTAAPLLPVLQNCLFSSGAVKSSSEVICIRCNQGMITEGLGRALFSHAHRGNHVLLPLSPVLTILKHSVPQSGSSTEKPRPLLDSLGTET
ncbi:hypothetical protein PoB_002502800 [Plakobranchus ocellatus]|uniref:Uncharacterized protein n=1 Tax=Plakobranchus ocellatus TaxID=259542 RepID=A0AAV3ZUG9_9GAST|nr:hypothetical protein PoB_002502800 [Plakobranchus ocellatus]